MKTFEVHFTSGAVVEFIGQEYEVGIDSVANPTVAVKPMSADLLALLVAALEDNALPGDDSLKMALEALEEWAPLSVLSMTESVEYGELEDGEIH